MSITVKNDGSRSTVKLRNMARRAEDLTPVWPRVGRRLSQIAGSQFTTSGARLGRPWKPLAARTKAEKRRQGFSPKPLIRTATLRDEYKGRPMQHERYTKSSAEFGSTSKIARWQSGGTKRHGKTHIPARPILPENALLRIEIRKIVRRYIVGKEMEP